MEKSFLPIIWENYRKYYRKPIYRHFSNYRQIIDIEIKLPEIIGDLKELSISISKLPGKLSKNYCYQKKWLIADPYLPWQGPQPKSDDFWCERQWCALGAVAPLKIKGEPAGHRLLLPVAALPHTEAAALVWQRNEDLLGSNFFLESGLNRVKKT